MKNKLDDIYIAIVAMLLTSSLFSCTTEREEIEYSQVSFTATLPKDIQSRGVSTGERKYSLWVGVFDKDTIEIDRKKYDMQGYSIDIDWILPVQQTYHFVFWASDTECIGYDISNLKQIEMLLPVTNWDNAKSRDAFYAVKTGIVLNEHDMGAKGVELLRPLAQVNVGTTKSFVPTEVKFKNIPNLFCPFTGELKGSVESNWTFSEASTDTFQLEGIAYKYLALGYLFAPLKEIQIPIELKLNGLSKNIPEITVQANYKSNIVGALTE